MSKGLQNALIALKKYAAEEKEMTCTRAVWEAAVAAIESKETLLDGIHIADDMLFRLRQLAHKDADEQMALLYKTIHCLFQVVVQKQLDDAGESTLEFKTKCF